MPVLRRRRHVHAVPASVTQPLHAAELVIIQSQRQNNQDEHKEAQN